MVVSTEQATVYRAGGRRWLTRDGAYRAAAKAKIRTRCECEKGDGQPYGYPGYICSYHQDSERLAKLTRRLAGFYRAADAGRAALASEKHHGD